MSRRAPAAALRQGIDLLEEINTLGNSLAEFASLRQSADTGDSEAASALGQVLAVFSQTAGPNARFQAYAAALPELESILAQDEVLSQYQYLFRKIREDSRYLLSSQGEDILARLQLSGANAWSDLQAFLTSSVEVDYNGGVTNLSAIRNLAYSPEAQVRKDAYQAELKAYDQIKDAVAFALNSIKGEANTVSQLRHFDSVLDMTLFNSRMKRETLDAMMQAIEEALPKFHEYLRHKAKLLGYSNGLPFYELFAPMGKSSRTFTPQQAKDYVDFLEQRIQCPITMVSSGPKREEMTYRTSKL